MNYFQWIFFFATIIFVSIVKAQNGQPIFYPGIQVRRLPVLQPNGQIQVVNTINYATPVPLPLERQQQLRLQRQAAGTAQLGQPAPLRQPQQQQPQQQQQQRPQQQPQRLG